MNSDSAASVDPCPTCGEPLTFEWSNVESGIEWGEARCSSGHVRPCGRKMPSAALTVRVTPFGWRDEAAFSDSWDRTLRSLDDTSIGEFREQDIAEVLYQGESGDEWDGKVAAVLRLKDGRLVAYETFYGPTGDGFHEDAYGGDAELVFASDLRLLVNGALTDEGRRLAGVPEELWNG